MNKAYIVHTFVTTRIVRDVLNLLQTGNKCYYYLHAHNNKMIFIIIICFSIIHLVS